MSRPHIQISRYFSNRIQPNPIQPNKYLEHGTTTIDATHTLLLFAALPSLVHHLSPTSIMLSSHRVIGRVVSSTFPVLLVRSSARTLMPRAMMSQSINAAWSRSLPVVGVASPFTSSSRISRSRTPVVARSTPHGCDLWSTRGYASTPRARARHLTEPLIPTSGILWH